MILEYTGGVMSKIVAIIGAGEIGQALATILRRKRIRIRLWDVDSNKVRGMKPLKETLAGTTAVFLCVPSWALRAALRNVQLLLPKAAVVVALSKGVEAKSRKTVAELLSGLLPSRQRWTLLSGPMLAEELEQRRLGAGVVATANRETFKILATLFRGTPLKVEWSKNPSAVAWAGVLKNVYAVGLGIADGLEWSWNAKGWFAAKAIEEMRGILPHLKFDALPAAGVAGVADFLATGFSPYSRNREFGERIVSRGECEFKSEGCVSLPSVVGLLGAKTVRRFPILQALTSVLIHHTDARKTFTKLFFGA